MLNDAPHPVQVGEVLIEDLGRRPFEPVLRHMRQLVEDIRGGRSAGRVLLVEHESVYTAGRATPPEQLAGTVAVERGGKVTWHGPGQLVVYPVVPLPGRDVRRWLQALESFGVQFCAAFGLEAEPSVDGTGVFVGDRKLASIGVAIRHWISLHGISINVAVDGTPWHRIRPCGLDPGIMTDLSRETGRAVSLDEAKQRAAETLPRLLEQGR